VMEITTLLKPAIISHLTNYHDHYHLFWPSPDEIEKAALWAITNDRSVEFRMVLFSMLRQMGFKDVAERI